MVEGSPFNLPSFLKRLDLGDTRRHFLERLHRTLLCNRPFGSVVSFNVITQVFYE
jgi:hypothetical protein